MKQHRARPGARRHAGIALIEVLVTLVILLFGLLGLAGISSRANMAELEAFQRIRALQLLQDMAARIEANRQIAPCYSSGATGIEVGIGKTLPSTLPACNLIKKAADGTAIAASTQQTTQLKADLVSWDQQIKGEAEVVGSNKVGAMMGAIGCITQDDAVANVYLIAVAWQGLAPTAQPMLEDGTTPFPCGLNAFGDEKLRRVLTTKVRIGNIS
ncbi:MAG: type IV pilus modification protein PilV [Proteobacteria bacterium]|nr:type IV pilus modification protein PilV [Pseudomonadota bacterium]